MSRSGLRIVTSGGAWMSAARTSFGPEIDTRRVTVSSTSERSTRSVLLRVMSVTSALLPGMLEDSWLRPPTPTEVTAAPRMGANRVARSAVAGLDAVRRDVDLAAVDLEVAVGDELAGLVTAHRQPPAVHDVVHPQLEELQQPRASDALGVGGLLVVAAELLLQDAVDAARLL